VSYQVLARKYRPATFAELVGQDHVVRTLSNAIETGRIAHAFLFVGPRGIGKTSIARILAKALNCTNGPKVDFDPADDICREIAEGRSLDVIEIDGASNNSVDQIRELNDAVRFAPSRGKFKIYYIDEVHMLSIGAFNALLKTLEEPPAHAKFIFATTEAHKLPATIVSRCQRFDLKRISDADLARQLRMIADKEGITVSESALRLLARNAEGGMRDAESAFDQLISFCGNKIEEKDVLEIFGLTGSREIWDLAEAIQAGDADLALRRVRALVDKGKDLVRLTQELLRYHRNLLVYVVSPDLSKGELEEAEQHHFQNLQPLPSRELLLAWIDELVQLEERIRFALVKEVVFEITMVRLAEQKQKVSLEALIRHLTGNPPVTSTSSLSPSQSSSSSPLPPSVIPTQAPAPVVKSTPTPEPKPAPTAPASPAAPTRGDEAASRSSKLPGDGGAAWSRVASGLRSRDAMLRRVLENCEFLGYEKTVVQVRMTASAALLESFKSSPSRATLEAEIKKCFDDSATLKLTLVERAAELAPETETATPATSVGTDKAKSPSPGKTPPPGIPLDKTEFENDPLIKEALKIFEARIVALKDA
jgi:DNA polymerase III subunit gamma/tau